MKQSEKYRSRHSMEVPGKSTEVPGKSTEVPDDCQELPWSRKKSLYGCHENAAWQQLQRGELRSLGLKGRFASKESSKIAFVCQLYFVILRRTNPKSTK